MTAFVDVNVIPMDTERVLAHQTVVVQNGLIAALGPVDQVKVPAGAVHVDGRGRYLIPGLANMHTHGGISDTSTPSAQKWLFGLLASGVTTLRDLGGTAAIDPRQWWARVGATDVPLPRVYVGPPFPRSMTPDSVAAYVAAAKASGYRHISPPWIYAMSRDKDDQAKARARRERVVFDSLVAAARRVGLPVSAHSHQLPFEAMLALGTTGGSTEHVYEYWDTLGITPGRKSSRPPAEQELQDTALALSKIPALVGATRRAGVWMTPTLRCSEGVYATPGHIKILRRIVKTLQDSGVGLLLSGDDGWEVHDELAALVRAGLSPYQALVTGTRNPGQYLRLLDSSGTVAVGKWADLVLLYRNPLQDIRYTWESAGVMLAGQWLDRSALDRCLLGSKDPTAWFWSIMGGRKNSIDREIRRTHLAALRPLADSLRAITPTDSLAFAHVLQRLANGIGVMRAQLAPEERAAFDPIARVWLRAQARQSSRLAIPGLTPEP